MQGAGGESIADCSSECDEQWIQRAHEKWVRTETESIRHPLPPLQVILGVDDGDLRDRAYEHRFDVCPAQDQEQHHGNGVPDG
ncbi:hypothetical protein BMS3Bbin04_00593 [bacterium BMS3Bbin04]|nr:hypothetical protein BMS3Bbin04_00593 [bacterium BMS3Bbin04]